MHLYNLILKKFDSEFFVLTCWLIAKYIEIKPLERERT